LVAISPGLQLGEGNFLILTQFSESFGAIKKGGTLNFVEDEEFPQGNNLIS